MNMPSIAIASSALFLSAAAFAAEGDFTAADANADGVLTLEEAQIVMPNLTEDLFRAADVDGSGALSQSEFAAIAS
jgi:hypothetical protein